MVGDLVAQPFVPAALAYEVGVVVSLIEDTR
jgi:hypothetical protein